MKRHINLIIIVTLAFGGVGAYAQIPAEVTNVMNHCREAMTNQAGLEYEMDMKVGMGPLSLKMHGVIADKGELNRARITTKILGVEIITESGFDGTNSWELDRGEKGDTITITRGNKAKKSDGGLQLDIDKQFNKAKMKHKDGYYEISFSDPKDKSSEIKSAAVKVSEKNYVLRELSTGARGAKVTMTVTRIRVGLNDSYFKIDLSKYPNAVIINK